MTFLRTLCSRTRQPRRACIAVLPPCGENKVKRKNPGTFNEPKLAVAGPSQPEPSPKAARPVNFGDLVLYLGSWDVACLLGRPATKTAPKEQSSSFPKLRPCVCVCVCVRACAWSSLEIPWCSIARHASGQRSPPEPLDDESGHDPILHPGAGGTTDRRKPTRSRMPQRPPD
jgi:hypothetical protein